MKPAVTDPPEVTAALWADFTGNTGWDIGANCGQTIPIMLNRFTHVVAFEPAEECIPYLTKINDENLIYLPIAISERDGYTDLIELDNKIDTGQLVTSGTTGMEWNPDSPDARPRTVPCRTIDTLVNTFDTPDFLKIDVEGHEYHVLFGARQTLALNRPDLLLEFHSKELHTACTELLLGFGYQTFTIRHPHYPPGSDLWFSHGWIRARTDHNPAPTEPSFS